MVLLIDGTEFFFLHDICCESCNVKAHKNMDKKTGQVIETKTYSINGKIAHLNL